MMPFMAAMLTLLVIGLLLLIAEFFLPGMIAGILGLICLIGGIITGYQTYGPVAGNYILIAVAFVLICGIVVWLKFFPDSRLANVFVLRERLRDVETGHDALIHQEGITQTDLRPSGVAVIGKKRVDVVTEGPHIERGMKIRVISVDGMKIVVRQV